MDGHPARSRTRARCGRQNSRGWDPDRSGRAGCPLPPPSPAFGPMQVPLALPASSNKPAFTPGRNRPAWSSPSSSAPGPPRRNPASSPSLSAPAPTQTLTPPAAPASSRYAISTASYSFTQGRVSTASDAGAASGRNLARSSGNAHALGSKQAHFSVGVELGVLAVLLAVSQSAIVVSMAGTTFGLT